MPCIPTEKPNHLLGIGDLNSLENCIKMGIDTFDSSHPTKCARHGLLFTSNGNLKIQRSNLKEDFNPIDKNCLCSTCKKFTRAYLHHLFKAKEPVAHTLATIHNLQFMVDLMAKYRQKILDGKI
jgi:queuine tRNA-ribosyltransferase